MNTLQTLISAVKPGRTATPDQKVNQTSLWAQSRFRHSMLGESGIHEAARLYGVGR